MLSGALQQQNNKNLILAEQRLEKHDSAKLTRDKNKQFVGQGLITPRSILTFKD